MSMNSMRNQQGAVLVVSLIMLLLITAIALSTLSGSTFQTAMTTNAQQRESILRVAESAAEQPLNKNALAKAYNTFLKWNGMAEASKTKANRFYEVSGGSLKTEEPTVAMSAKLMFMNTALAETFDPETFRYYVYESHGSAHSTETSTIADAKLATQVMEGVAKLQRAACDTYDPC